MLQILTLAALTAFAPAIQQLGPGSPGSEIPDDRDEALVFRGSDGELEVRVPRVSNVEIRIDGRLDEEIWRNAAVITGFTQYEPVEGIPATENTEVYVVYSSDAIYFGIRAFDSEPDLILARLGERDRSVFGDDWVRIMLDTFNDQRQAYVFYVNPLGIQTDGLWIEGMQQRMGMGGGVSIDFNPDFIWESDGRVDDQGWAAEIKIPYVSLRFENVPVQDWGINVTREVKRRGFKQSWAPLTQNISSTLAQSGHL
ncbi:MAG: carbohydrate binding family 9 domain-containing protein, partial [Gemmatimonadota bacterium]|nr:carbohydrate binding family 9 domain-containing protein [Gemmatimonadota bacterium]